MGGKIADDDTLTRRLTEEAFGAREVAPVAWTTFARDVFYGIVEDDLIPKEAKSVVELVFFGELAVESPTDTLEQAVAREGHEITADVEFDDKGFYFVVF